MSALICTDHEDHNTIYKEYLKVIKTRTLSFKNDFGEVVIYDNRPSSTILYKARTNTLQLNDSNRHTNKEIHCLVCDTDDKVDIYHFMLHCTAYQEQRSQSIHLQQPYLESDQNTVG